MTKQIIVCDEDGNVLNRLDLDLYLDIIAGDEDL